VSDLRTAAVLVPVYRDADDELRIVLVVRADDGGLHGGQLGLPGGKPEPDDADLLATALREAHEEVGLSPEAVEVVAELHPFDTRTTGWRVHPFLGRVPAVTTWRLSEAEIVGILTPAARALADPRARGMLPFTSLRFP
jgi:8-oxo-dGTP pyrophosphatase MutT (NUDIX family)